MRPLRLDAQQWGYRPTPAWCHITFDTLLVTVSREEHSSARWRQLPALLQARA
jgi:hypothetical protein